MPETGNNPLSGTGKTIHIDMSGFSFSPDGAACAYVGTPFHTLVPSEHFSAEKAGEILEDVTGRAAGEWTVMTVDIPEHNAVLIYSIPPSVMKAVTGVEKSVQILPEAFFLLESLKQNHDFRKMSVLFSDGVVHIAAAEGERLLLLNSYQAFDFVTVLYYLLSVTKEVMMDPEQTVLQVYGVRLPDRNDLKMLERCFAGYKEHQL